jgi:hypothetical protein
MAILCDEMIAKAGALIFREGRLLERKLFECFFGSGTRLACVKALRAYQNPDGGFGNGIEPDLLCPDSTAIGAETALYVMDILETHDAEMVEKLVAWIENSQNAAGFIRHPPAGLHDYPHQPWWIRPDDDRILALVGVLAKWGVDLGAVSERAGNYSGQTAIPEPASFYSYPLFLFLKYCGESEAEHTRLGAMVQGLPALLDAHRSHFPLFSRYWYHAAEDVQPGILAREAGRFAEALDEDGGLQNPYPDLPWWRSLFTLDGLILLRKNGFL